MSFLGEAGPVLRFNIRPQDPKLSKDEIRLLIDEATKDAEAAARADHPVSATPQPPGPFAGVGEISVAVHLLLPYLNPLLPCLEEAGKGLVGGVFTAAGEYFFRQYLAPRLRRRNLLPSKVEVETEISDLKKPAFRDSTRVKPGPKPSTALKPPKKHARKPAKKKSQRRK